ncbi:MAG: efflux RND transporter periplasmic adaptor subunit [Victivallaceae bacterium]|nr:efflux RND transporter periplasmic adaptor subunit [Victivallaceae bacterium]
MKQLLPNMLKRRVFALLVIVLGIGITLLTVITGPRPKKQASTEREQVVKAIKVAPASVAPRITGYGEAVPAKTWKAVAQVDGKVIWKSPKLKGGEFFAAGELMLRLDDSNIKLAIHKCEAGIKKYQAKIGELNSTRTNMEAQLKVMKKILEFNVRELARQEKLHQSRAVAATTVEKQEITVLQQHNAIISLESSLRLLPAQIEYQQAELSAAEASLKQAKLDLEYAQITAPFDCRVNSVNVEMHQYVTVGQEMVSANGTDEMEIPAQFSLDQLEILFNSTLSDIRKKAAEAEKKRQQPDWKIKVKANGGNNAFYWDGHFLRMASGIDTTTRMTTMVVGVSNPYRRNASRPRPPLDKGQFCSVEIIGQAQPGQLVVPRYALHAGKLYLADRDSRLEIRPVKTVCCLGQYAVIASGLKAGETVIISDLVPAIKGMKLSVSMDRNFAAQAAAELAGAEEQK